MAYANINFKSKKALKTAVAEGKQIGVHQVGPFADRCPQNGKIFLEGPWYPEPHRWYAECVVKDGIIQKVK